MKNYRLKNETETKIKEWLNDESLNLEAFLIEAEEKAESNFPIGDSAIVLEWGGDTLYLHLEDFEVTEVDE